MRTLVLLDALSSQTVALLGGRSCLLHQLELFQVSLLLFDPLSFGGGQLVFILRQHLLHQFGLDVSPRVELRVHVVLALSLNEPVHMMLHEVHPQYIKDIRSFPFVLDQEQTDQVLEFV